MPKLFSTLIYPLFLFLLVTASFDTLANGELGKDVSESKGNSKNSLIAPDFTANKLSVCDGQTVIFTDASSFGSKWEWDFGAGASPAKASGKGPHVVTYNTSGKKTITLLVDDVNPVSKADYITVNQTPADLPLLVLTPTVCSGSSASIVLENTTLGVDYQLRDDNTLANASIAVAGNGSSINFSTVALTSSKTYQVFASNGNCPVVFSQRAIIDVVPNPVAAISPSGNTLLCNGDSLLLSSINQAGLSYQWFRNNTAISNANGNEYYAHNSAYYHLRIVDANGCSDNSDSTFINLNTVSVSISPNVSSGLCDGDSVKFVGSGSGLVSYQWLKDGAPILGANSIQYTAKTTGFYQLRASNVNACAANSAGAVVTFSSPPIASIQSINNPVVCIGDSLLLKAVTGTDYNFQWIRNGQDIPAATFDSIYAKLPGNYQLKVRYLGCANISNVLTIIDKPGPTSTFTALSSTVFCIGDSVKLKATITAGLTFKWTKNDTIIDGAIDSVFTAKEFGNYRLRTFNSDGCRATSNPILVNVKALPDARILSGPDRFFCTSDSVRLRAFVDSNYTYQWLRNGVVIPNATDSRHFVSTPGPYQVVAFRNGCSKTSLVVNVVERAQIMAQIGFSANDSLICQGDSLKLLALSDEQEVNYSWLKDGIYISNAKDSIYYAKEAGNYQVQVRFGSCNAFSEGKQIGIRADVTLPTVVANKNVICENDSVKLSYSRLPDHTYQWQLNNSNIASLNQTVLQTNLPGNYTLLVKCLDKCTRSTNPVAISFEPLSNIQLSTVGILPLCLGDSIVLQSNVSSNNYQWLKDGQVLPNDTNQAIKITAAGNYQIRQTSLNNCVSNSSIKNIPKLEPSAITVLGSKNICPNDSVKLVSERKANYNLQWLKDGLAITGETDSALVVKQTANYQLTYVNANFCVVKGDSILINVLSNTSPVVSITGVTPLCVNDTVVLTAQDALSYQWFKNGAAIPGANKMSYATDLAGIYNVKVTYSATCSGVSKNDTIGQLARGKLEIVGNSSICEGESVVVKLNGFYSGYRVLWSRNGEAISNGPNSSIIAKEPGIYTAVINNLRGCVVESDSVELKVLPKPQSIITYNQKDLAVCAGDSITFTITSNANVVWFKNNTAIPGATSKSYTSKLAGSYYAILTGANACSSKSDVFEVTIDNNIPAKPTVSEQGSELVSSAVSGNQWFYNATLKPGETNQKIRPFKVGLYSVQVSSAAGCKSPMSDPVNVNTIGISTQLPDGMSIYPNPVQTILKLTYPETFEYQLYDALGSLVFKGVHAGGNGTILLNNLSSGTYYLRLDGVDLGFTYRLIKE